MKTKYLFFILPFFIAATACKKERDPIERIELTNPRYSINCLNCEQHGQYGTVADYSSVKVKFDYSTRKAKIGNGSYLLVIWKFEGGANGDYMIDYNNLTLDDNTISFDGSWYWAYTPSLRLELILYSGKGSKSDILRLDIPKPVGANRIVQPTSTEASSGGYVIKKEE